MGVEPSTGSVGTLQQPRPSLQDNGSPFSICPLLITTLPRVGPSPCWKLWSALVCTGLYWSVLVCTVLYWFVLICTDLYWSALVCTGLFWPALVCSGLFPAGMLGLVKMAYGKEP